MIAIEQIRRNPDAIRQAMQARGEPDPVDTLLELDAAWRRDRTQADELRNRRNQVNRQIGHARAAGHPPDPQTIAEMRSIAQQIDQLETSAQTAETQMRQMLLELPNPPSPPSPPATTPPTTASSANKATPPNSPSPPNPTGN